MIVAFATAVVANVIFMPAIIQLSHRKGFFDTVDARKVHTGNVPRLGGVGIFGAFVVGAIAGGSIQVVGLSSQELSLVVARTPLLIISFATIFSLGLVDDFSNIPAFRKLLGQVVAALLVVLAGYTIESFTIPFFWVEVNLGIAAAPVTVLYIIALSNAINLIDGIDGFAGGVSAFAALTFGVVGLVQGNTLVAVVSLALAGAIAGFLLFNLPPARIFMGDSGSLFLGHILAVVPLLGLNAVPGRPGLAMMVPATILVIPLLDTASAIFRRARRGLPIHAPDREHLHHKLLDLGLTNRQILVVIYLYMAILGSLCVAYWFLSPTTSVLLFVAVLAANGLIMGMLRRHHEQHHSPHLMTTREKVEVRRRAS
jgi:UDP-GlcNAc:undecaprenyl-phosphate GlcNAc-1-phosphate transferase